MTLATTETRIADVLASVMGMGKVYDRIRTEIDRGLAEEHITFSGDVNVWEFSLDTETLHDDAGGLYRDEGIVSIVAHYKHDDENNSRGVFRDLIQAVSNALMNVGSGFPQIKEPGVVLLERPTEPIKMRTGHSAYRARLEFRLWNLSNT